MRYFFHALTPAREPRGFYSSRFRASGGPAGTVKFLAALLIGMLGVMTTAITASAGTAAPPNDEPGNAQPIGEHATGYNNGANDDTPAGLIGNFFRAGVWFSYTADKNGRATFTATSLEESFQPRIAVTDAAERVLAEGPTSNSRTVSSVTVDVTGGVTYFVLVGSNSNHSADRGPFSLATAFTAAPTITAPDAPVNVRVVPGSRSAQVLWDPPAFDGGSPIIDYRVTAQTGQSCTSFQTSCVVTELAPRTRYTFQVAARNAYGWSLPSVGTLDEIPEQPGDGEGEDPGNSDPVDEPGTGDQPGNSDPVDEPGTGDGEGDQPGNSDPVDKPGNSDQPAEGAGDDDAGAAAEQRPGGKDGDLGENEAALQQLPHTGSRASFLLALSVGLVVAGICTAQFARRFA